jgi:hypothetical protein
MNNRPVITDVCMTIYPVKQKYVDSYKKNILAKNQFTKEGGCEAGPDGDLPCGNYRGIQPKLPAHKVQVVVSEYSAMVLLLTVISAVLGVLCFMCTVCCFCYCCKFRKLKA